MKKIFKIKNNSNRSNKGFTLLEVIFAMFVLLIGVLGVYILIQDNISKSRQSSFHLTAAYLAQEGVEIIRNLRDQNWLKGKKEWDTGIGDCNGENFYQLQYDDSALGTCGNQDMHLKIINNQYYGYRGTGNVTPFIREIRIAHNGDDEIDVEVKVYWDYKGERKGPVTVKEKLYNWRYTE